MTETVPASNGVHSKSNGTHLNGALDRKHAAKEVETYDVPKATAEVFKNGILSNPLLEKYMPADYEKYAAPISFTGSALPSIPINWRFAESVSALKAFEGMYVNALLSKKYGVEPQKIAAFDYKGRPATVDFGAWSDDRKDVATTLYPHFDIHENFGTPLRTGTSNLYRTSDGRYFHLHGSLNPEISMKSIGISPDTEAATYEDANAIFQGVMSQISSAEMDRRENEEYKQAGTIAWTVDEFKNSEHGKANEHIALFDIHPGPANDAQKACWWKDSPQTGPSRPLAGLKVVDITRIIAAPAVTKGLAELGASVMRITAPHQPDFEQLHGDLNWGKWNCCLDFRKEEDKNKLKELIRDADVVVSGYRPGVMEKWGFGPDDVFELCKDRDRGIIFARENCYGWNGPWKGRSGWQQISDACCGVSIEFGRAMGNDEAVTPVFPNSDYCTGLAGVCGIIEALLQRGEKGGSHIVDLALNYYSQWLVDSVGTYSPAIWQDVWARNGKKVLRHTDHMQIAVPTYLRMLTAPGAPGNAIFENKNFEERHCGYLSKRMGTKVDMRCPKPILQFPEGLVKPGFTVSTRGNGADEARWPDDLTVDHVQ